MGRGAFIYNRKKGGPQHFVGGRFSGGPPFFSWAPSQADVFFLKRPPRSFRSRRVFEKKASAREGVYKKEKKGWGSPPLDPLSHRGSRERGFPPLTLSTQEGEREGGSLAKNRKTKLKTVLSKLPRWPP